MRSEEEQGKDVLRDVQRVSYGDECDEGDYSKCESYGEGMFPLYF